MPTRPSTLRVEPLEDRSTPAVIVPYDFYTAGIDRPPPRPLETWDWTQTPPGFVPPPSSVITITRPTPPASEMKRIGGTAFHDVDRDGVRDVNEAWGAGVRVYLDRDHNGRWDSSEPIRRTGPGGTYDHRDQFVVGVNLVRPLVSRTWRGPLPAADEHVIAAVVPPNFVGPLPPSIPDPRVVVESLPAISSRAEPWPALRIGPDGKLLPLAPAAPSPGTEVLDWRRVL